MNIPVDGIVITGTDVLCDESAMTGESDHLPKMSYDACLQKQGEFEADGSEEKNHHSVPSPLLLSGTNIQKGMGWFICVVVGDMTCEG
jgi:magnesium-transporting ATPase (P-type)